MKEAFVTKRFQPKTEAIIDYANTIIAEYSGQGFVLTLRQLYYQFVARDMLENTERNYDRLGEIISKARLAGLVDWAAIEDRARNLQRNPHWPSPEGIIRAAAQWGPRFARIAALQPRATICEWGHRRNQWHYFSGI